jgi:acyl-lipid omega-6 desaturase (Delta-12 desaturase)
MSETTATSEQSWRQLLAPYKKAHAGRALFQLLNTAIPFGLVWYAMFWSLGHSYLLTLLLAVPAAFLFTRLFIIQHDCGHGAFFPSRAANNALGSVLGVITLFPYGYWRRTHAIHHATTGNLDDRELGDIHTLTVAEYQSRSPWRQFLYRLYRHPLVLFGVGPAYQFVIKHRFPFDIPWSWKREWQSVLWTNIAIAVVGGTLVWTLGWQAVLLVHLPIVLLAGSLGVWLFYVQHQFEDTYWDREDAWDFYRAGAHGSSFYDLPRVLHWLTGNIGYHHIHHLSSVIPNYNLPAAFRENPSLQQVTKLSLGKSLRCAGLKLWDEERRALVGFRGLSLQRRQSVVAKAA